MKKLRFALWGLVVCWLALAGCSSEGGDCLQANGLEKHDLGCAGISYTCEVDAECPSGLVCMPGTRPNTVGSREYPADCIQPAMLGEAGSR